MKDNSKIIIVFSGKQFSGKDTVAKILLEKFKTFKRIGIADAIKLKYSEQTGISIEDIEQNKSLYRKDLIELGNWGRAQNPDFWLDSIIEYKGNTIVTDIRMKHELDLFCTYGAFTIRVEASEKVRSKRGQLVSNYDTTETELDNILNWDYIIENNGSYEELKNNTKNLIVKLQSQFGKDI